MLWYLATPYSKYKGGIEAAFVEACRSSGELIRRGIHVYSPIAHTHPIAIHSHIDPYDHKIWMSLDEHMMKAAGGLIVVKMPGWKESYGIGEEIKVFSAARKPIRYMSWPHLNDEVE